MQILKFLNFCFLFLLCGLCLADELDQTKDCKKLDVVNFEISIDESLLQRRLKLPKGITIEIHKTEGYCSDDSKPLEWPHTRPLSKEQILNYLKETYLIYYGGEFHQYFGSVGGCTTYGTVYYKNKKHIYFEMNEAGNSYFVLYYKGFIEARYGVSDSWKNDTDL